MLPRVKNLPSPRRDQRGRICSSRGCMTNELWSCVKRHGNNGREQYTCIHLFFLRLIKKSCEHKRDRQTIYNYFFVISPATVRWRPTLTCSPRKREYSALGSTSKRAHT